MALTIPDNIYNRIMTCVGFPIISEDDLGVPKEFIVDNLITPAVQMYYKFFPIRERQLVAIGMQFSIDFPDDLTIGVLDARLNSNMLGAAITPTQNPLINDMNISVVSQGGARGMWGTHNDYGYSQVRIGKSMERQSIIENTRTFRFSVDENNRKVDGFSNIAGWVQITWAKMSEDWAKVSFRRQEEVIDLAKSYVLQYFGELRNQASSQLPTEMTGEGFLDRASTLRESIETKWSEFTKVTIQRG